MYMYARVQGSKANSHIALQMLNSAAVYFRLVLAIWPRQLCVYTVHCTGVCVHICICISDQYEVYMCGSYHVKNETCLLIVC